VTTGDDTVPFFSARGNPLRYVDLIAPGAHVASLAVPGSQLAGIVGKLAVVARANEALEAFHRERLR